MEKLKFVLFSVVVLALFFLAGYWAVASIQSGSEHVNTERIKKLENENEELKEETEQLKKELSLLRPEVEEEIQEEPNVARVEPAPTTVYKYQELIDELQELIDDNVVIRLKSRGTRVGTVQKFLNIYNKTSNRVDNDYGASTKSGVAVFQKDQGLPADGEAGQTTFSKMIDWLKKQG